MQLKAYITTWKTFLGTSSIVLGLLGLFFKSCILEFVTSSILILNPNNSLIANPWRKTPAKLPMDMYLFNWTNIHDIHNRSVKPMFQEVGPYQYWMSMEKTNVVWNDNDTVTFNQLRKWYFNEEQSKGSLKDRVTTINFLLLAAGHYTAKWDYFIKNLVGSVVESIEPTLELTKTVDQFLFQGLDNFLVDLFGMVPFIASEIPRWEKFGWFAVRNDSDTFDGTFNMGIGKNGDFDVHQWNYYNVTPYFEPSCAKVHGSGGEFYSRQPEKDALGLFFSDLCRYINFDFEEEMEVEGILGYKYIIGQSILDNGTNVPGNECYCAGECIPSGVFNFSSCKYGLPLYASLPHFYSADKFYTNQIDGMQPQREKHEAYVVVEPKTNVPLKLNGRLQVNMRLHPIDHVSILQNVPELYIPLFWCQLEFEILPEFVTILKRVLLIPTIAVTSSIVLITAGLYLLFLPFLPKSVRKLKTIFQNSEKTQFVPEEVPLQEVLKNEALPT